jgi:hypothetical protein
MDGSRKKKRKKKKRKQRQKKKKKAIASYDLDGMDGGGQRTEDDDEVGVGDWRAGQAEWGVVHAHAWRSGTTGTGHGTKALPRGGRGALIRRVETHGRRKWVALRVCRGVLGCWDGRWLALHELHYEKG